MTDTTNAPGEPDVGRAAERREDTRTLPRLLEQRAHRQPRQVAAQEKRYGIWQPMTWQECHERVRDFAHGLARLGVQSGEAVAVIGDNRPEWLIAEFAAQSLGASIVGIDPGTSGDQIERILQLAEVRLVVVEGQEQVDELADRAALLPLLATVVYYNRHGLEHYTEPYLREFGEVEHQGRSWGEDHAGWLDERLGEVTPEAAAVLAVTSATGRRVELVELTHHGMVAAAERISEVDPVRTGDRYVCLRALAGVEEQTLGVARGLTSGICLSFPEQPGTQRADLREVGPEVVHASSRLWESMLAEVQERLTEAGWLRRTVFDRGYRVGEREAREPARRPSVATRLARTLADWTALRPVRDHLGLTRARQCYVSTGSPGPQVFEFFHSIGVNLKQIYGSVEVGGIVALRAGGDGTPGVVLPGIDLSFSASDEVLLRGDTPSRLHRDPGDTAGTVDARGWWHTGDIGHLDDYGRLVVLGRPDGVVRTADGRRFARTFIESALRFSPYIQEAVVVGEAQPSGGVGALVSIEPQSVGSWAEREHLASGSHSELAAQREVRELIRGEIDRANRKLPQDFQVRHFAVLHRRFDPGAEVTAAHEVHREVVASQFAELIDAMRYGTETDGPPIWQLAGGPAAPERPAWRG